MLPSVSMPCPTQSEEAPSWSGNKEHARAAVTVTTKASRSNSLLTNYLITLVAWKPS